jgi:hypothetical protein
MVVRDNREKRFVIAVLIEGIANSSLDFTVSSSRISGATANIPSPRHRAEKAPQEQSILLTCCNLTRKKKRTCPCNDWPTSSYT